MTSTCRWIEVLIGNEPPVQATLGRGSLERRTRAGIALAIVVFLVDAWPRIAAPFGNSHDGRNGIVWLLGADSVLTHGPVTARLGAWAELRGTYAHHPPGTYMAATLADAIGDHPALLRAPAWLASLAAIPLLVHLLRKSGVSSSSAATATALVVATPMFLLYGPMLNMEALSLPLAVGLLLAWQPPVWSSERRTIVVAAAGSLCSYQGIALGLLLGAVGIVRGRRGRRRLLAHERGTIIGTVLGGGLAGLWLWWANDGFGAIVDQTRTRTDTSALTVAEFLDRQLLYLTETVPPWVLAGALLSLLSARHRKDLRLPLVTSTLLVVAFAVLVPNGSGVHVYWNYLILLPVALCLGPGMDRLAIRLGERAGSALAAITVVGLAAGSTLVTAPELEFTRGLDAHQAVTAIGLGPDDEALIMCTTESRMWLSAVTERPARELDVAQLVALADTDPDAAVFVNRRIVEARLAPWEDVRAIALPGTSDHYGWVPAADLAGLLGRLGTPTTACGAD